MDDKFLDYNIIDPGRNFFHPDFVYNMGENLSS